MKNKKELLQVANMQKHHDGYRDDFFSIQVNKSPASPFMNEELEIHIYKVTEPRVEITPSMLKKAYSLMCDTYSDEANIKNLTDYLFGVEDDNE